MQSGSDSNSAALGMIAATKALGISEDALVDKVVSRLVEMLVGDEEVLSSRLAKRLEERTREAVNSAVEEIAGRHVLPNVASYVEGLCLQQTNQWGEKAGKPVTFVEYLVARAEAYLQEPVNYEGKPKSAAGGFSWQASQSRVAHMIDSHLHYSIKTAMERALADVNSKIATGLQETVKVKLAEVLAGLKVQVKT